MSNQIVITSGAKLRDLDDVIIGTDGILSSVAFNVANGVPRLDENGKILVSQLPNSVMEFKGVWNAATNTPTLANGTGNAGDVWLCNVAGTVNFGAGPIAFAVGDYAVYTGTVWARSSGATGTVTSVGVSRDGNALAITGSPVTTSGTINLGFSGDNTQYINGAGNLTTFPTLITSIGLTMPAAFNVSNSPLTANGTIGVTAAGYPSQYIRGDGTLADFPTSGGGGSSVSYYLNGGTSQGTIGGTTYYEMSKTADTGTMVDFSKSGNGLICAFLTDAGDPALLQIPAGNWNYEIYASMSANGGTPEMYAELYVYNGTTFTLISTSSNEILYDGTNLNLYTFAMTVPQTTLTVTDRLAIKLYATNSGGKTTTVHTQDSHLCQVITTFSTGLTALNGLTAQVQYFGTGTSGSDFNIVSSVDTHTFNLPNASATKRGALSAADWYYFNGKQDYITAGTTLQYWRGDKTWQTLDTSVVPELTNLYFTNARARTAISLTTTGSTGASTYDNTTGVLNIPNYVDQYVGTVTSVAMTVPTGLSITGSPITTSGTLAVTFAAGYSIPTNASQTTWDTAYTNRITSLTTTGSSGSSTLISNTLNIPTYTLTGLGGVPTTRTLTINGVTYDLSADRTWTITAGISSVSGTAPISVSTVSGAATVSISQVTTSTNGYLSSTDWNTFNGKQNSITLTTTGSSGAATLVGSTLNIPNYGSALSGYVPYTGATTYLNLGNYDLYAKIGYFANSTVFYTSTSTDTNGGYIQAYNGATSKYQPFRIYGASDNATNQYMQLDSSGLYVTSNVLATGYFFSSMPAGSVLFAGLSNQITQNQNNFYWDNTNLRLGIGNKTPIFPIDAVGGNVLTGTIYGTIRGTQDQTTYRGMVMGYDSTGQIGVLYSESAGAASSTSFYNYNGATWKETIRIKGTNGFIGFNTSNPTNPLHITNEQGDGGIIVHRNVNASNGSSAVSLSHNDNAGVIKTASIEVLGDGQFWIRTGATGLGSFGTERLRIGTTGLVGINMAPLTGWYLAVKSGLAVQASSNDAGAYLYHDGSKAILMSSYESTAGWTPLQINVSGSNRLYIDVNGNIIQGGTTKLNGYSAGSTTYSIAANGTDKIAILELRGTRDYGENQNGMIMFYNNFGTAVETARITATNTSTSNQGGQLFFSTKSVAGSLTDRMIIYSTGTIRIGDLSGSGSRIVGTSSTGDLSSITIGTGLSLSGGVLTATGGGSGTIGGSGTSGYIPKFTGTSSIGNGLFYDNGTAISLNSTTPTAGGFNPSMLVRQIGDADWNGFQIEANGNDSVLNIGYRSNISAFIIQGSYRVSSSYKDIVIWPQTNNQGIAIKTDGRVLVTTTGVTGGGTFQVGGDVNITGNFKINGSTLSSGIGGSGTTSYIPRFSSSTILGNSTIQDNGTYATLTSTTYVSVYQNITWKGISGTTYDFSMGNGGYGMYILSAAEIDLNAPIGMRYGLIYTFKGNGSSAYNVNVFNSGIAADELQFLGGLKLNTTTCGFVPPKMTTTQKNALSASVRVAGCIVYDTTINLLQAWNGSTWNNLW